MSENEVVVNSLGIALMDERPALLVHDRALASAKVKAAAVKTRPPTRP